MAPDRRVLWVTDLHRSIDHYTVLFGCAPDRATGDARAVWQLDDGQSVTVESQPSCAGTDSCNVTARDLEGCARRLDAAAIDHTVVRIGDATVLTVEDPDGNLVALLELPPPDQEASR